MIHAGELPIITLNLTEDELTTLVYAVAAFQSLTANAPIVESMGINRSDAMRKRRAAKRFHERIQSLGKAYGIETP